MLIGFFKNFIFVHKKIIAIIFSSCKRLSCAAADFKMYFFSKNWQKYTYDKSKYDYIRNQADD